MSDTKIRAPLAVEVLRADHENVKVLFSEYEEFGDDSSLTKQGIFEEILRELAVHARLEEEILYPAVATLGEDAGERVREALEEHRIFKMLLSEIAELAPDSPAFDVSMRVLQDSLKSHVEGEEKEIFPLYEALGRERQDEVSEALWRRKAELSRGTAGDE